MVAVQVCLLLLEEGFISSLFGTSCDKSLKKVAAVVANRASYARVKPVLSAIKESSQLKLQLIAGSSALLERYGPLTDVIRKDGFSIDGYIYMIVEGSTPVTMAKSAGLCLLELPSILESLDPDIVLAVADRFETLPVAMSASYLNIPVAHLLGGEVTGSIDESVRHSVTKLSHLHFTATRLSGERVVKMGEPPERVFVVGCPSIDIASRVDPNLTREDLKLLRKEGVGAEIDYSKPFVIVLQHPVTTEYGEGLDQVRKTLKAVDSIDVQGLVFWPNVDAGSEDVSKGIRIFREKDGSKRFRFIKNLPAELFMKLMTNCLCIVGNSSSAIREGSFLGTPAVNIGTRQQGRERGSNVMDVDHDADQIRSAVLKQISVRRYPSEKIYGDGRASERVSRILAETKLDGLIQKRITY